MAANFILLLSSHVVATIVAVDGNGRKHLRICDAGKLGLGEVEDMGGMWRVVEATPNVFVKIECEVMKIHWKMKLCKYVYAFPSHPMRMSVWSRPFEMTQS